ncbi:ATP-binding protein [Mucilaginibacter corticis]|uniref:histidine kinase n=1 Tax=Mucilaginibacter corticis TaxID=2597670 RepID=A0A556M7W7_9SPHI|nr:ATP-binding protein [Mucilaginibacter corticis]
MLILNILLSCNKPRPAATVADDPDYKKAKTFLYHQDDSAFYYFNKVATRVKDSLQAAFAYNYMASIQSDAGDYFGGQESLSAALKYLDTLKEKDRQCLSSTYNELGLTSIRLRNNSAAIAFFDLAIKYSDGPSYKLVLFNNKALAYRENKEYQPAIRIYDSTLLKAKEPETYARILSNSTTARWLYHPSYNAAPELLKALAMRVKEKDLWGQNSSYAHLADFYKSSRPDSSLWYSHQMYTVASKLGSPDDVLEALEKLISTGPQKELKGYFARYQKLSDSLETARSAAKNQFALIRYNTEKAKTDNLRLQKDNTNAKYQILGQRVIIGVIIAAVIGTFIALFFWYRKRKQEQQAATLAAVRDTQLKDSKKVHDTLANDIYYLLKKVQNDDVPDKDWLVNHIDEIYERARDISYEITPAAEAHFHENLSARLKAFATDTTRISLVGNSLEFWDHIDPLYKTELKYILQELMVNMRKHSHATNVVIRFEPSGDKATILYTDNGIGMAAGTAEGNGLKNTGNRIKTIGGAITFDSSSGTGLQIKITCPYV